MESNPKDVILDLRRESIASEIALNETLSNSPSMSRKVPKTYPILAILRSMVCAVLCNAVSVEVPLLKPSCFLLVLQEGTP